MDKIESVKSRPRTALVTNHGYAGKDIPLGGAPDTGGQNFYVNYLAAALEEIGFDVTVFARGGFPFFESDRIREGIEEVSRHTRYVYVPGGGNTFILKEDIASALDEEVLFLERYISEQADAAGCRPWEFFEIINTHYWDAGIMAVKLVERWQNIASRDFMKQVSDGVFAPFAARFSGDNVHKLSLSREIFYHLGEAARGVYGRLSPAEIVNSLTGESVEMNAAVDTDDEKQEFAESICIGGELAARLQVDGVNLLTLFKRIDTHVWTPHSLGIVKERNFWGKDSALVRALKFRERDAHEQVVTNRSPLFCATSPEIWRALIAYHGLSPECIFDFPPCIDGKAFHPRSQDELAEVYTFLSERSGLSVPRLEESLLVFETSRMDETKRKDLLLGAFAEVAAKRSDVYLFIGGGPEECAVFQKLRAQIERSPVLKGRAFLLGFVSETLVEPLFSAVDLFVSASEMEGFGMSVSQAAAAGVAIVSSDLIPFATHYSKNAAVVVPAGYQHGFALAMNRLLNDGEERSRRAEQLLEAASAFDWTATAERFVGWFREKRRALPGTRTTAYPNPPK